MGAPMESLLKQHQQQNIIGQPFGLQAQQQANIRQQQQLMNQIISAQAGPPKTYRYMNQPKKRSIMKLFRDYLEAHRDTIFTLVLILLADHFVFKGAFSETIKAAFSKLLAQAHKKIDEKIVTATEAKV